MSDISSVIFSIQGDATDPLAFCLAATGKFPDGGAVVGVAKEGEDKGEVGVYALEKGNCTAKEILEARTIWPGEPATFWLAKSKGTIAPEDMQPYTLLSAPETNKPLLVVLLEGDLPSFVKTDSAFSPEYHAVKDYLEKKIDEYVESHPDIEDMEEMLSAVIADFAQNKEEIETELFGGKRGMLCVITANGEKCILKHAIKETTDWGWTSDLCEGKAVAAPVADKKPFFKKRDTPAPAQSTNVSADKPTNVAEMVFVKPGPKTQGNAPIKQVWAQILERKWEEIIKDKAFNEKALLNKEPVQILKSRVAELSARKVDFVEVTKVDPASGTQTTRKPEGGSAVPIPLLSTKSKEVMLKLFKDGSLKGVADGTSSKVLSTDQIKVLTEKFEDFVTQLTKVNPDLEGLRQTLPYCDFSAYADIAHTDANASALLNWSHGCELALWRTGVKTFQKPAANVDKPVLAAPKAEDKKPTLLFKKRA